MYYIKRFIIASKTESGERIGSTLDLAPGLNIVYGPSNTGKTLILDCVDFMLGGEARRLYKPALRIYAVTMILDVDGAEVSLYRELDEKKNDIIVISKAPGIEGGTYTVGAKTKDKDTISSLWLKLMGIDKDVKIIRQIEDSMEQALTVRTFYHFFVINENRISGENSILKAGSQTYTKNIPVPTITSLIYLAKELNYISPNGAPKTSSKIITVKRTTAQSIVDGSVNAMRERETISIKSDDPRTVEEIQTEINEILEQISAAEDSLQKTTDRDQIVTNQLIEITSAIAESTILKNRYNALRTQYESDMRRLTFIAEADIHKGKIPKLDHCPFCNGELPKEKTQSCLDAAIAEADKIELRIKDLQYADEALSKEMDKLQSQREALVREQQQVQAAIRGELRPQVDALRDKLAIFTAALEKAKAKEMLKHFTEVLNEQLLRIKNEDEFSNDFDVREKIREVLQEPLERLLTEILEKCNYDNYVGSRFDEDMCDVVVNGSEKLSQGQGFRAFLNSVMALAVQEMLNEFNMHMPHLLVMDSPILSLKEREEDKGTEITSDSMRGGLFQYMIEHEKNRQTIILENEIPTLDYSTVNIIHFTRKVGDGRFGLIEGYRD
jgi:hypothetical protein